ncbi:hypothetical protein QYM36_014480 [Artemia franciscana]|uniref:Uncharacterized protein n=1 Tax=Artemia franciscana TaxID=6661 RepID=A0AA88L120_ARTSF|nr:hypothetical protein QYM36_014480 [Artemia franciscana]
MRWGKSIIADTLGNEIFESKLGECLSRLGDLYEEVEHLFTVAKDKGLTEQQENHYKFQIEQIKADIDQIKENRLKWFASMSTDEIDWTTIIKNVKLKLPLDANASEAVEGYRQCVMAASSNPEEVRKNAKTDPKI